MVRLGDYISLKTGKLDVNASSEDGKYPFFTCATKIYSIDNWEYDCECVLIAGNGDLNVKYYEGKFNAYQRTYILESKDKGKLDVRYLFHFMNKYIETLREGSIGGVIKYIKKGDIEEADIPLGSIDEQRRIAAILDKADEIKEETMRAVETRAKVLHSLFYEMFGDPFLNEKGLKIVSFESLTNRITYGFTKPMKHLSEGIPILTGKNVRNGWIDYDNVHYAEHDEYHALTAKSKPEKNDILITKDGSIGRTALFNVDFPVCINQSVALVKPKHEVVNPNYLVAYLNSNPVQRKIQNMGKGGALKHLQITELAKFPVVLPDIKNQNKFVEISEKVRLIVNVQEISETNVKSLAQELLS
jgi:type I restriction enzyme, S subunit